MKQARYTDKIRIGGVILKKVRINGVLLDESSRPEAIAAPAPVLAFDPDRVLASLEAARWPWKRTEMLIRHYANQADCANRRMAPATAPQRAA